MSNLVEALLGWLTLMSMVLGGVGVLFFVLSAINSLAILARRIQMAPPGTRGIQAEAPAAEAHSSR